MKKLKKCQTGGIDIPQQPGINPYQTPTIDSWYANNPDVANYRSVTPQPETERVFDPMQPNAWALGLMGAYAGSKLLLNKSREKNYEKYKADWIRRYSIPSLIQDPNKFSSIQYEAPMARKGGIMQDGGLAPVYTSNPNDPRLRAYQDSLILSNASRTSLAHYNKAKYSENFLLNEAETVRKAYKRLNYPDPVEMLRKELPFSATDNTNGIVGVNIFKKPVQPIEYRKRTGPMQNLPTKLTIFPDNSRPTVGTFNPPDTWQPGDKTNYSYTTAGDGYLNQNVTYMPTAKDLKNFLRGKKVTSSQEGSDYMTATGYEKGGIHIDPSKRGTFKAQATRMGMSVQEAANAILNAPKGRYSAAMRKKANFAKNFAKQYGGMTMNTPEDQGLGYYGYPNASSLTFPGSGERTFVPGPFPLMVKDDNGTQIMTNKPVKTKGRVTEIPIFQEGGEIRKHAIKVDREDATIEAEKGELILGAGAPGDVEDQEKRVGVGLYKVGGKSHTQGGTPLLAHPGDFVFSNDKSLAVTEEESKLLIGKEIKKLKLRTPAKLAEKYLDLNEFIDLAQNEKMDPITRKTAMLNINNFIDRLAEIAYVQEEKKDFPDGIPAFVQASMDTRFDAKGLQDELSQFRQGGSVLPKHQVKGLVTDDIRAKARLVDQAPQGYELIGSIGGKQYYRNAQGQLVPADKPIRGGTPSKGWRQSIIDRVKAGQNPDDLMKNKMIGDPAFRDELMQYYKPAQTEDYVYTPDNGEPTTWQWPNLDRGPLPTATNRPGVQAQVNIGQDTPQQEQPLSNYLQGSNDKFNVNLAEAYNVLASVIPSKSRYPTAYRNEEIQNAKALIASSGRPISEQPYLNANRRALLGYDQNNNASGAAGATRGLAAFASTLGADNQAISQVYNQNILRGDQRAAQLANLEVMDGQDRIMNAEKYDNKLEMLANNKEREARNMRQNLGLQINQMQKDRESKRLFNVMSDYYQINRDNSIGLKPTYKIENGKVVPYQRNVAELIRSSGTSTNNQYLERARQIFELMNQYGIKSGAFVDELIKDATNPTGSPK